MTEYTIIDNKLIMSADIETRRGFISCFGIGWSSLSALCIPFMCVEDASGYWNEEEELAIMLRLKEIFEHPNIALVYQNGLYDFQYHAKLWGFIPTLHMDTMLVHHTLWSGLPKGLDFQSSIYCDYHRYWKDEGKGFHESIKTPNEESKYWVYNCKDCTATFEIMTVLSDSVKKLGQELPAAFQMRQFKTVFRMMLRGVKINKERKERLGIELFDAIASRETYLNEVVGYPINIKSPKQMQKLFYEELNLPVFKNRTTGRPTTDDNALSLIALKEPLLKPVTEVVQELRSLSVFLSTFVRAPLDTDERMRSSYNIAGTETFRWSSSKDAFGTGMNLQNIPKGNEE